MEGLGARIRALRKAQGLTQKDLGERLGVSQVQISNYELGIDEPPASTLPRLAQILDTSVQYLLTGSHDPAGRVPFGTEWEEAVLALVAEGFSADEVLRSVRAARAFLQRWGGEQAAPPGGEASWSGAQPGPEERPRRASSGAPGG